MLRQETHHKVTHFEGRVGNSDEGGTVRLTLPEHAEAHFDAARAARERGDGARYFKHTLSVGKVIERMTGDELREYDEITSRKPTRKA